MKVYALFSIENNYDQPDNNLVCLWLSKPTFHDVQKQCVNTPVKYVGDLTRGRKVRIDNTDYRIEEVSVIIN